MFLYFLLSQWRNEKKKKKACAHTLTATHTHVCGSIIVSYPSGIEVLSLSNLSRLSDTDGWQTDRGG